jgi:hypothetical protein
MLWVGLVGAGLVAGAVRIFLRPRRRTAITFDRVSDQWLAENRVDRL